MTDESRTPNEHTVKSVFVRAHPFPMTTSHEERRAEFDRFLAGIKADALREFIRECRERGDVLIGEIADTATEVIERIEDGA